MLVYRVQEMSIDEFCHNLEYLITTNEVDFRDFNYDLLKTPSTIKLLEYLIDYVQLVEQATHISGSLIDHVYVKKNILEELHVDVNVQNIFFSDHDAVRIVLTNDQIDFSVIE